MSNRKSKINKSTSTVRTISMFCFGAAAVAQGYHIVLKGEDVIDQGEKSGRYLITTKQSAKRGSILTADGKAIAEDDLASELGIDFSKVPQSQAFFMELSEASGIAASELMQLSLGGVKSRYWREPMSAEKSAAISKVKSRWKADGISIRRIGDRNYPLAEATSGIVGFLRDEKPAAGLELGINKLLTGKDGEIVGMMDRYGAYLPMRINSKTKPKQDGTDVTLTIDSHLQTVATSAIRNAVEANKAESGSAIIMDPKTGDILAMANWPTYDPNEIGSPLVKGERVSDFNPCYMAALEPGSTFKILSLAIGLEKGVVSPGETLNCGGALSVWAGRSVRCDAHGGSRAHGATTPEKAIAVSCNVSAASWALRVGYGDFTQYMEKLGLFETPDLKLPLNRGGSYNREEYAKRLQLATLGFGQSLTATPVNLTSAFSSLANSGERMAPRLIKRIGDKETPIVSMGKVFKPEVSERVLQFMESVVASDRGTGKTLRIPGYRLGGKTGTAQKINPLTGTVENGGYISNFVGMVPADKPQAVILVMVDDPKGGKYYGAQVAGPVFVEMAKAVIRRLNIPPSVQERMADTTNLNLQKSQ